MGTARTRMEPAGGLPGLTAMDRELWGSYSGWGAAVPPWLWDADTGKEVGATLRVILQAISCFA